MPKGIPTILEVVGLLRWVGFLASFKGLTRNEGFLTHFALVFKWVSSGVDLVVLFQGCAVMKGLPAHLALVHFLFPIHLLKVVKRWAGFEGFPTLTTFVISAMGFLVL
ncbi:hypothetical protein DBR06_SOUSAS20510038, partial [Sousa chinensis]